MASRITWQRLVLRQMAEAWAEAERQILENSGA
jgi:hypothetical protein